MRPPGSNKPQPGCHSGNSRWKQGSQVIQNTCMVGHRTYHWVTAVHYVPKAHDSMANS